MCEAPPVAEVKHPTVVGVWEVFWGARTLRPIRQLVSSIVTCRLVVIIIIISIIVITVIVIIIVVIVITYITTELGAHYLLHTVVLSSCQ